MPAGTVSRRVFPLNGMSSLGWLPPLRLSVEDMGKNLGGSEEIE